MTITFGDQAEQDLLAPALREELANNFADRLTAG
jgi:hypothetical protein